MKMPDQTLLPGVLLRPYEDADQLAGALSVQVANGLRRAIADKGHALMIVSGGRTPAGFFRMLATENLSWDKVTVLPSDERWVAVNSEQRNSRMIRDTLLQGSANRAHMLELVEDSDATPEQSAEEASGRLHELAWPADVVVLGMGADGHTASLFPDAPELASALAGDAPPVLVTTPPSQSSARLTLCARVLAGAGQTTLLIQGEEKRAALQEAVGMPLAIGPMPVRYFFQQPLEVFWSP